VTTTLPLRTGFRRPFTIRAQGWVARPTRLNAWTRRLSSTSATSFNPRAQPPDRSIPRFVLVEAARPACAGLGGDLRKGITPSATSTADSGRPQASARAHTLRYERHAFTKRRPRLHGPEAGRLSPSSSSHHHRSRTSRDGGASPQPDPLRHLLSRNRGNTGWSCRCSTTPPGRSRTRCLQRSRLVNPALTSKREQHRVHAAATRPAFARPAARTRQHHSLAQAMPVRSAQMSRPARADQHHLELRGASPDSPRRDPGSAAPKVPSIDKPPSRQRKTFAQFALRQDILQSLSPSFVRTYGAFFSLTLVR